MRTALVEWIAVESPMSPMPTGRLMKRCPATSVANRFARTKEEG
jgi:hypothetical protein